MLLILARWTVLFIVWPMRLIFHEAGHIVFSPFGELITVLGGTLMQLLVPIACWIAFATTSPSPFGMAVMCWWTGDNLVEIAYYVNDARSLSVTLLGGFTGAEVEGHDWEHILGLAGLTCTITRSRGPFTRSARS